MTGFIKRHGGIMITYATQCAWRAVYVSTRKHGVVAHIGIDPTAPQGPQAFGGFHVFLFGEWRIASFRFALPHVTWRFVMRTRYNRFACWMYRVSSRMWRSLDGRRSNVYAPRDPHTERAARERTSRHMAKVRNWAEHYGSKRPLADIEVKHS